MKRCVFFLFVTLFVFGALPLFGQDEEGVEVPPITVTYTRTERDPGRIPADVTVIDRDQIERSGAESVPDLLRREAGINVTIFSGTDKFSSVGMRGFSRGLETMVMVNGVPLTMPTIAEVDWSIIPLSTVERIEITRGPGGVLYGDRAVAGVINVITKKAFEKPFLEITTGGGTENTFDSSLSMGYGNDWGRISFSGGYHSTDGYRDNNYYDHGAWSLSAGVIPSDVFEATLDTGYSRDAWGSPGALFDQQRHIHGKSYSNTPNDRGQGENFYSLLGVNLDFQEYGRIELEYDYRNNYTRSRYVYTDYGGYRYYFRTVLDENDVSVKYILDLGSDDIDNRVTLGVDYRNIGYHSDSFIPEFSSSSDVAAKRDVIAGYIYDELTLYDRFIVSLGYRYEYIDTSYKADSSPALSEDFSEWALSAGLVYRYGENKKVFFRFEHGYRVPALDEIFQYEPVFPYALFNSHLPTERVTSFEVGVKHAFSEKLSGNATFWWSQLENEIYYDNLTYTNDTYDRTIHRGFDIGLEAQPFEFLNCWLAYGFQDAVFDTSPYRGKTIPLIPKHTVSFGIGLDYEGFSAALDGKFGSGRVRDGDFTNAYRKLPAYFVMNARLSYTYRQFEFFAGVKNITDAYYADYGGYKTGDPRGVYYSYPNPGRSFYGGITMRF